MLESNYTMPTEFLLVGFTDYLPLGITLFLVFFIAYILTVVGNVGLIILVNIDSNLQTPMYYLLSNLSFLDICYSTSITPKMLVNFLTTRKSISPYGCALQMIFFCCFADAECLILAAMSYDRYAAICYPLLYPTLMSRRVCIYFIVSAYFSGSRTSMVHVCLTFRLPFCGSNIINHFIFSVIFHLFWRADTHINELLLFALCSLALMHIKMRYTFCIIMISYIRIIIAIQRIRSAEGRRKAFSTCASHLTTVTLFYGSVTFSYMQPSSRYSLEQEKVSAVFYTLVIPMLNPLIYSLRNKDVKDAAKRSICWKRTST
ncbi:Olfactory receptor 5AS1 [Pteropus alecto]|uniref:Olfactory receptor n=1 Tax=Pteropus alecto TaxID=9402 RepID=L5JYW3_PTEAL|nr:Olfactory receptor 5AS1 [Pteropus alecto]